MSVYQNPSKKGKWFCDRCKTWSMDTAKRCSFCSKPKPPQPPKLES